MFFFFADFKQGNVYWDSFFWLWCKIYLMHNKILHRFFSNYKALLSRTRASFVRIYTYKFLRKKQFFVTFWVWLYEKQLGSLRGISHSPRCCWYVKSLLFSFWVYMIKGDDTLTEFSSFEVKWVEQKSIQTLQPGETKIIQMRMYQFKLTKS